MNILVVFIVLLVDVAPGVALDNNLLKGGQEMHLVLDGTLHEPMIPGILASVVLIIRVPVFPGLSECKKFLISR